MTLTPAPPHLPARGATRQFNIRILLEACGSAIGCTPVLLRQRSSRVKRRDELSLRTWGTLDSSRLDGAAFSRSGRYSLVGKQSSRATARSAARRPPAVAWDELLVQSAGSQLELVAGVGSKSVVQIENRSANGQPPSVRSHGPPALPGYSIRA